MAAIPPRVIAREQLCHELLTSDRAIASNIFPISAHHMCLPISPEMVFVACATTAGGRGVHASIGYFSLVGGAAKNSKVANASRITTWRTARRPAARNP
jgi:hypothetical protein